MAISSGFGFSGRPQLHFCHCFRKVRFGSVAAVLDEPDSFFKGYSKRNSESVSFSSDGGVDEDNKAPVWKRFSSKELGISNSMIPRSTRVVLNGLNRKGGVFWFQFIVLEMNCYIELLCCKSKSNTMLRGSLKIL
nr:PREDICTED: uncharacterized protein LOC108204210 [Daucus carota subsp. sativus]